MEHCVILRLSIEFLNVIHKNNLEKPIRILFTTKNGFYKIIIYNLKYIYIYIYIYI